MESMSRSRQILGGNQNRSPGSIHASNSASEGNQNGSQGEF